MKLNLLLDNAADVRNGYVNVDHILQTEACNPGDPRQCGNVANLDDIVCDGEASEIVAHEILDWFPGVDGDKLIKHWLKKLAHGGRLTVSTLDLNEVAKGIRDGLFTEGAANELIFGAQKKPWQFRKSAFTLSVLVEVFTGLGYKVIQKRVHNYRAVVTCERP